MAEERVQKILSNAGFCSRRKAEDLIADGRVSVNDKTITLGDKADADKDQIKVYGKPIIFERKRYLKFYKPLYTLTSRYDPSEKPTIFKHLEGIQERVYPVGRLDYNGEGLLILTNDGDFANKIMHPRYETEKVYQATLTEPIDDDLIKKLGGKIILKDGFVQVHHAKQISPSVVEIKIHEGRNKIVKRIINHFGYKVKTLLRTQINDLHIGSMQPGEYRDLSPKELKMLLKKK